LYSKNDAQNDRHSVIGKNHKKIELGRPQLEKFLTILEKIIHRARYIDVIKN
jgi:hypothetical protein